MEQRENQVFAVGFSALRREKTAIEQRLFLESAGLRQRRQSFGMEQAGAFRNRATLHRNIN
jgi:hypothetical protein